MLKFIPLYQNLQSKNISFVQKNRLRIHIIHCRNWEGLILRKMYDYKKKNVIVYQTRKKDSGKEICWMLLMTMTSLQIMLFERKWNFTKVKVARKRRFKKVKVGSKRKLLNAVRSGQILLFKRKWKLTKVGLASKRKLLNTLNNGEVRSDYAVNPLP